MTTVQRGCRPKKATSSSRRSLRLSWTLPSASTPWRWKVDLAVSMPIMLMLIAGGSPDPGPDDRTLAHRCRRGPSTPAVNELGEVEAAAQDRAARRTSDRPHDVSATRKSERLTASEPRPAGPALRLM